MIGDRHLHTCFSLDSNEPVRKVIEAAVRKGMKEICITDHCDFDLGEGWILPMKDYTSALISFKEEYRDVIDLHIGVEIGLNPEYDGQIREYLASYPFEFVIGSVHTMLGEDPYYRDKYDMDDEAFYRIYFENVLDRLKTAPRIDALGHLDYVVRYGEHGGETYEPGRYETLITGILQEVVRRDIALELNTAGLRKGLDFIHPHPFILDLYRELGGRQITLGSDAHEAADAGAGFEAAEKVMADHGFTERDIRPYR